MNILLLNIRNFIAGGSDRYMYNVKELLESNGHEVSIFSVDFEQNNSSKYEDYFAPHPGDRAGAFYADLNLSFMKSIKFALNTIYSPKAKKKIKELISVVKPDICYAISIQNYLSPSVLDGCREMGVPVVHRISDFGIMCSRYTFLRDGQICEKCYDSIYNAVRYSCGGHEVSKKKAIVRALGIFYWRYKKVYERSVNIFITPTNFMKDKLIKWGFDGDKIVHLPTFTLMKEVSTAEVTDREKNILYFGRISSEKGLMTLLKAFDIINRSGLKLIIAGNSPTGYIHTVKLFIAKKKIKGVEFKGHLEQKELTELIKNANMTVVPSIWYENMPNSILESFKLGTPVIASKIGSIPELIEHGVNGLLFEPGDHQDLAINLNKLLEDGDLANRLGESGKKKVNEEFTPEVHYNRLITVFNSLVENTESESIVIS